MDELETSSNISLSREVDDQTDKNTSLQMKISMILLSKLNEMRMTNDCCDLSFQVGTVRVVAHKAVLAAWSPPLETMLHSQPAVTATVEVSYPRGNVFTQFISILYTGIMDPDTDIVGVLELASSFQISWMISLCEEGLNQCLNTENIMYLYRLAVAHDLCHLQDRCIAHLRENLLEFAQKRELLELNPQKMDSFLQSPRVFNLNPEIKLFLIISWLKGDVLERQKFLAILLKCIDWSVVAQNFLMEIHRTENFFTSNPGSLYILLQTLYSSDIHLGPYVDAFKILQRKHHNLLASVVQNFDYIKKNQNLDYHKYVPVNYTLLPDSPEFQESNDLNLIPCASELFEEECQIENEESAFFNFTDIDVNTKENIHDTANRNSSGSFEIINSDENKHSFVKEVQALRPQRKCSSRKKTYTDTFLEKENDIHKNSFIKLPDLDSPREKRQSTRVKRQNYKTNAQVSKRSQTNETKINRVKGKIKCQNRNSKKTSQNFANQTNSNIHPRKTYKLKACVDQTETKTQAGKRGKIGKLKSNYKCKSNVKIEAEENNSNELDSECNSSVEISIDKSTTSATSINCGFCNMSFAKKRLYFKHLKKHFIGPPYKCFDKNCDFTAYKLSLLLKHHERHLKLVPLQKYICKTCNLACLSKKDLERHCAKNNHEKFSEEFECPVCGKGFKQKTNRDRHIVTHGKHRPYLCDLCGFATKYQSHLTAHKRIHTGEIYSCSFPSCKYQTPRKSLLKSHALIHGGERAFKCQTCSDCFLTKAHLRRHEKRHNNIRSHKCPECPYATYRQDLLTNHINNTHRKPETQKIKRDETVLSNSELHKPNSQNNVVAVVAKNTKNSTEFRREQADVTNDNLRLDLVEKSLIESPMGSSLGKGEYLTLNSSKVIESERGIGNAKNRQRDSLNIVIIEGSVKTLSKSSDINTESFGKDLKS